jgi:1-acyl-sn-glycerol-3-phosphate acyltransferase
MLFYLIISIIIYIIFLIGLYIIDDSQINNFILSMTKNFLYFSLFKSIHSKSNQLTTYFKYLYSDKPIIIVSNHRSLFDGIILLSVLSNITFLVNDSGLNLFPGISKIAHKLKCIKINSGPQASKSNTTDKIIQYSLNRKAGQPILVIFPDKLENIINNQNIAPFKTGAFVGKIDILPILIKYKKFDISPYYWNNNKERGISSIFEKYLDKNCEVDIEILPLMKCKKKMTIEEYKDSVYNKMNTKYSNI